jgi:elongation factor G
MRLHGVVIPPPVFMVSVIPDGKNDEDLLKSVFPHLEKEDPSCAMETNPETGQIILSGMGELHLEILRDRIVNDFKVKAQFGSIRIAYRECIGVDTGSIEHHIDKDILSKRAVCGIQMELNQIRKWNDSNEESDNDFFEQYSVPIENITYTSNSIFSKTSPIYIDRQAIEDVQEDGKVSISTEQLEILVDSIKSSLFRGPLYGYPLLGTQIHVKRLFFHPQYTTAQAIQSCVQEAVRKVLSKSQPMFLEPIMYVTVRVASKYVRNVLHDLNTERRASVLSMEYEDPEDASSDQIICVIVPLEKMVQFSSVLRSLTSGMSSFEMKVIGYRQVEESYKSRVFE